MLAAPIKILNSMNEYFGNIYGRGVNLTTKINLPKGGLGIRKRFYFQHTSRSQSSMKNNWSLVETGNLEKIFWKSSTGWGDELFSLADERNDSLKNFKKSLHALIKEKKDRKLTSQGQNG